MNVSRSKREDWWGIEKEWVCCMCVMLVVRDEDGCGQKRQENEALPVISLSEVVVLGSVDARM